jgi:hypothetical protein
MRRLGTFYLFLLCVHRMLLCDRVELLSLVLLARVLFSLVIVGCVVDMTFPDAVFVAFGNHANESIL